MNKQKLIMDQIDKKISSVKIADSFAIPQSGWIYSIRQSLGMSLRQLGGKLKITPQSVKEIEVREENGSISLNVLRQVSNCLDMKLIYVFVPKSGSLEQMIENRALEIARDIVLRTSGSMILEDQGNSEARLEKAILEKAAEIKLEMPRYLWD